MQACTGIEIDGVLYTGEKMIHTTQTWKIGDCIQLHPQVSPHSIDMILTDLPYGNTKNHWDVVIDPAMLWTQYNKIIKNDGAILLFGQGMFTATMMASNSEMWRYNLIWKKAERATGFLNANKMPLRNHEDIMVFYKSLPTFCPQFRKGMPTHKRGESNGVNNNYGEYTTLPTGNFGTRKFPLSVLNFEKPHPPIHPTQKPVPLLEYLIKTYTNEGDTILDSCLGSGTTLEACRKTNRNCIGFEISDEWEKHYANRAMSHTPTLSSYF